MPRLKAFLWRCLSEFTFRVGIGKTHRPKNVPVKSRYFHEVSAGVFCPCTNKGGTAIHKPRPFRDRGFFVFIFTKGK